MIRHLSYLLLMLAAAPVAAQDTLFCQELWLSRNTVMDRAGQCFRSALGQAVFDNSDCVDTEIRLNPLDAEIVRLAQEAEARAGCAVDIEANRLSLGALPFHARLMALFTVPVGADSEHGCSGHLGAPITLYAGISTNMTVLGRVEAGQTFTLSHGPLRGGWEYQEVFDTQGTPVAHGWAQNLPADMATICALIAG
ncbi:DUF4453 domain-containing protein [Gymnodinialimonas sp. 57CJ19]|uniref:DUF4453 domain-containing protein n=1 Tax=Gymnodinialimonas sp. 57CJ19 TaxID=3138498 RepID=UPI00313463F7